jgi:TetR/AcrR family transcriptional repressor of nem operon
MMAKSSAELGGADLDVDRIVGDSLRRWRSDLVDCLVEAQGDGAITAEADPQALATMLLGLLRGLEVLRNGGVKPAQLRAAGEQILALVAVA